MIQVNTAHKLDRRRFEQLIEARFKLEFVQAGYFHKVQQGMLKARLRGKQFT